MYNVTLRLTGLDTREPQVDIVTPTDFSTLTKAFAKLDALSAGELMLVKQAVMYHTQENCALVNAIDAVFGPLTTPQYRQTLRKCEAYLTLREALLGE